MRVCFSSRFPFEAGSMLNIKAGVGGWGGGEGDINKYGEFSLSSNCLLSAPPSPSALLYSLSYCCVSSTSSRSVAAEVVAFKFCDHLDDSWNWVGGGAFAALAQQTEAPSAPDIVALTRNHKRSCCVFFFFF